MDVVTDLSRLPHQGESHFCVLATTDDERLAQAGAELLGLQWPLEERRLRRPGAMVTDGGIELVLMVLNEDRSLSPLHLFSRGRGALIIGAENALSVVRPALESASRAPWMALIAAIVAVAHQCEEMLAEIDEDSQAIAEGVTGYSSSEKRRLIGRLRADLFRIGEVQAAQHTLLTADDELVTATGKENRRAISSAARAFEANQATTTRVYAMLGDVLKEQDSVVSERLTLVATIFLPLTLATGFFGMNFKWLVDRVESFPAFIVLGIVVPALLAGTTLIIIRRLTRST